jgi:DNA (cytosine-5)-methyltransferase 1
MDVNTIRNNIIRLEESHGFRHTELRRELNRIILQGNYALSGGKRRRKKYKILSLFSGIGGFELGLKMAKIPHEVVGYSEINPKSIEIYEKHFPRARNLGDVSNIDFNSIHYNMVVGGSPCTDISKIRKIWKVKKSKKGLKGDQSSLFYRFVDAIRARPRTHFILENVVSMKKETRDKMTKALQKVSKRKVHLVLLNGLPMTGQARRRYFWTTWHVPEQKNLTPFDWRRRILPKREARKWEQSAKAKRYYTRKVKGGANHGKTPLEMFNLPLDTGMTYSRTVRASGCNVMIDRRFNPPMLRRSSPLEAERLMGFPDNYTVSEGVPKTWRYRMLGNAVMPQMVAYVVRFLDKPR